MANSILELIPESLREDLIKEVKEKIKKEEEAKWKTPPSKDDLDRILDTIMP